MKPDSPTPGILCLLALIAAILVMALMSQSCADYPITLSLHTDHAQVIYHPEGIEIQIEK
jgi:fructose/tagatose bisphosphate aldolase